MSTITWLHLSDLHFRADDEHNRKVVLDALREDIKARIGEDELQPDFIVFTGDVAWHGWDNEYKLAEDQFFWPLLDITKRSPKELFIVPGNHDVDWDMVAMLSPDIPARLGDRDAINDFLASGKRRQMIFQSLEAYAGFIRRLFAGHWEPEAPAYYYVRTLEKDNRNIALLGLNSAWLSGFAREGGQVNDYGHLLIGEKQVAEAVERAQVADVRIALMHHPFEWLQEFDRDDAESWLRGACHFILRGHRHRAAFVQEATLEGETVIVPAGAAYDRREYPNGYSFVQLDLDRGRGTIYLRRYADRQRRWIKNLEATGEASDGRREFVLPGDLRVAVVPPVEIPPIDPQLLLLRDFERGLQRLADAFSRCEAESRQARIGGRGLNDDEYRAVARAWEDSRGAYLEAQALASRTCSEARWGQWKELIAELEKASGSLDEVIAREMRRDIPTLVWGFDKVLGRLRTEVSVELDRLLGGRWLASSEEVRR